MNSFQMAWRSVIRKPVKSILLFFVVLIISLFFLSGMASRNASIATQNKTKQAVGAGFLMEANEENKRDRADEILAKKTAGEEGNFDGVTVKKFRLVRICEALNCGILDVIELEKDDNN